MKKILMAAFMLLTGSLYAQVATNYEIGTWSQFKTATVSYTMDDNCSNQLPVALPLFDKYNFKVTFFTVINWSPNWSGLLTASKNGHEVGSHTMTHPTSLATLSIAAQNTELQQSQTTINANITNAKCVTLAYPNCNRSDLATTQKYYIAGRVCSGTVELQTPADFYNISSIITGNTGSVQTAANLNSKVAAAKSSKGWCVFLTHGIDNDGGYSPTQSTELASHLSYMNTNSADFWVAPFGTVVKYIKERNVSSVTETVITNDSLKVVVADNLDNTIYNVPITIRRLLPTGWQNPKVYLNSTLINSSLSTVSGKTYIVFDAVPNQGNIFLANKSTAVSPAAPTVSTPVTYCQNATATALTATGTALKWYTAATGGTSLTSVTPVTTATGTTNYYVSQTVNGVESSRALIAVTVNALPAATITAAGATGFCTGGNVVLNANTGTGLIYKWNNAAGIIAGATSSGYTASTAGSYTVTVSNANCSATSTATAVTVNTLPTATITAAGATSFCTGGSVVLNANTGTGLIYKWNNAAGIIAGATSSGYTATAAGSYMVTVSNANCSATSTATAVTVNSLPAATITAAGATGFCTGGSVVLNANTGTGLIYTWNNAAGVITGVTSASYTATAAGSYTVTVSNASCSATSTATAVTVNALPTATITAAGATTFCTGGSVVLNANTGTGLIYKWNNAAGIIAGATSASYTASTAGSYTVTVSSGTCSATSTATAVTVNALPTATITAAGATGFCTGGSVVLNANTGTGLIYKWNNAAGVIAGATSASYTASAAGSYTVTISNANCSATSTATAVTVNASPTATITAAGTTGFCTGGSVVLNANTGTGLIYKWNNAAGIIAGATSASYTATAAGSYTVTVSNGNCSATSTATAVTVNSLPKATITAAGATSFCAGGSVVLNANTGTGLIYTWNNTAGVITGATASGYTATAAGSYTVTVSNGNCSATSTATTVTVNSLPTATITAAGATSFCTGGSVVLNANAGPGLIYKWNNAAGVITGATSSGYTATAAGSYTVTVSNANCSATSTATAVTVNSLPTATITAAGATSFCAGGSVVLNANTGTGLTYTWNNAAGVITGATASGYTATAAGSYTVTVSNGTCSATSTATAVAISSAPVWYLDTDGDGKGDATVTQTSCTQPTGYVSVAGDACPSDPNKIAPGICGCGNLETDTDGDTIPDCTDTDDDNDGIPDGSDCAPLDARVGAGTVWYQDEDGDSEGDASSTLTACTKPIGYVSISGDGCPNDADKTAPGICGCGKAEGSCTTTGIQNALSTTLQIYPNPSETDFTIVVGSGDFTVTFYNASGLEVLKGAYSSEVRIGSVLPSGMYLIRIEQQGMTETRKIIKK